MSFHMVYVRSFFGSITVCWCEREEKNKSKRMSIFVIKVFIHFHKLIEKKKTKFKGTPLNCFFLILFYLPKKVPNPEIVVHHLKSYTTLYFILILIYYLHLGFCYSHKCSYKYDMNLFLLRILLCGAPYAITKLSTLSD